MWTTNVIQKGNNKDRSHISDSMNQEEQLGHIQILQDIALFCAKEYINTVNSQMKPKKIICMRREFNDRFLILNVL